MRMAPAVRVRVLALPLGRHLQSRVLARAGTRACMLLRRQLWILVLGVTCAEEGGREGKGGEREEEGGRSGGKKGVSGGGLLWRGVQGTVLLQPPTC